MTAQAGEFLRIGTQEYHMENILWLPEDHSRIQVFKPEEGKDNIPEIHVIHDSNDPINRRKHILYGSTACWRGYIGTWELKNRQLYLVELLSRRYALLDDTPIFANWYTGRLIMILGEILKKSTFRNQSIYEYTLTIMIERGVQIDEAQLIDHRSGFHKSRNLSEHELRVGNFT